MNFLTILGFYVCVLTHGMKMNFDHDSLTELPKLKEFASNVSPGEELQKLLEDKSKHFRPNNVNRFLKEMEKAASTIPRLDILFRTIQFQSIDFSRFPEIAGVVRHQNDAKYQAAKYFGFRNDLLKNAWESAKDFGQMLSTIKLIFLDLKEWDSMSKEERKISFHNLQEIVGFLHDNVLKSQTGITEQYNKLTAFYQDMFQIFILTKTNFNILTNITEKNNDKLHIIQKELDAIEQENNRESWAEIGLSIAVVGELAIMVVMDVLTGQAVVPLLSAVLTGNRVLAGATIAAVTGIFIHKGTTLASDIAEKKKEFWTANQDVQIASSIRLQVSALRDHMLILITVLQYAVEGTETLMNDWNYTSETFGQLSNLISTMSEDEFTPDIAIALENRMRITIEEWERIATIAENIEKADPSLRFLDSTHS